MDPVIDTKAAAAMNPKDQERLLNIGTLFNALAADPRYRKEVLKIVKTAAPETLIPELDLESVLMKQVEEKIKPSVDDVQKMQTKIDTLEKQIARKEWRDSVGLTEAEAVEVEELAKKGNIGNSETAVDYWRSKQQLGTPRGTRRPTPGSQEYLTSLAKVSPRNQRKLKDIAMGEAVRVMETIRRNA